MREIAEQNRIALNDKYKNELHCNEVMLLPYYIASMNIEHEFLELMGHYQPYEEICLADTFELAEGRQVEMFAPENTKRLKKQQTTDFFVIIGNPPYNAGQINENDNNKNRKYKVIDERVKETYSKASKATNRNALSDPYVKAIRWASDRIGKEGLVAFVSNNSFLDSIAFDGMRQHLGQEFSKIYHINLKGNARTSGERRRQEGGNVFDDMIRVSIGITFFIKYKQPKSPSAEIFVYSVDDYLKSLEKKAFLGNAENYTNVQMQKVVVDKKHTWLTEGLHSEFEDFLPLGTKTAKQAKNADGVIFRSYSCGIATASDAYVYNSNYQFLIQLAQNMVENYQSEQNRWQKAGQPKPLENFLQVDESRLKWIRNTKRNLLRDSRVAFNEEKIRISLYRPFYKQFYYFERIFNEDIYQFPKIFPTPITENENRVICVSGVGHDVFRCLIASHIVELKYSNSLNGGTQCFPFYTYAENGSARQENITNWTLHHFQRHYQDPAITKWAIFHTVYGLLHHPSYREKYAANLKRELPRLPMSPDFWAFSNIGEKLADCHLNYEQAVSYPLKVIENKKVPFSLNVEKMNLSKDKKQLKYNDFITLTDIPKRVFDYKLGNRSALEWVIDQYRVKVDKRSGIINDPNREEDKSYILELVKKIVTVSLETLELIEKLPDLETK
jgi:predicted helicase